MLSYLVGAKGRRRLLSLLWVEHASGTATQLAQRARVSFATAYRELQRMKRWGLVTTMASEDGEVFAANTLHPQAHLLAELAAPAQRFVDPRIGELRAQLAQIGAPLRAGTPSSALRPVEDLVLDALQAARRDPEIARVLPVVLYQQLQHGLSLDRVVDRASLQGSRHVLGFFLALTAQLSNDPALARRSRRLRDHRVKNQELFLTAFSSRSSKPFGLARSWGLRIRADAAWFEGMFRKAIPAPADA